MGIFLPENETEAMAYTAPMNSAHSAPCAPAVSKMAATLTRSDFDNLHSSLKAKFCRDGGKIIGDGDADAAKAKGIALGWTMTGKQFNACHESMRREFLNSGGKIAEFPATMSREAFDALGSSQAKSEFISGGGRFQ